jgi:sterol desaturase/sphingolipid hydroxylase (fatty acid hydroxylase superfamily)
LLSFLKELPGRVFGPFFSIGSTYSLTSLFSALVIVVAVVLWRRPPSRRDVSLRALFRTIFPRRVWASASVRADAQYFVFNTFLIATVLGWAIVSQRVVAEHVQHLLTRMLGPVLPTALPGWLTRGLLTLALFLAYELGYWLDHYLSHRVPVLWEFHKVHHSATVLTPFTVARVHPLEMLKFGNILSVTVGLTQGLASYALGQKVQGYLVGGSSILLVACLHAYVHLQHSNVWITFPGALGRLLLSPAHHQIHHSADPAHYDRNFGSCLALWDAVFGTLYVPPRQNPHLRFGISTDPRIHSTAAIWLWPVVAAARLVARRLRGR